MVLYTVVDPSFQSASELLALRTTSVALWSRIAVSSTSSVLTVGAVVAVYPRHITQTPASSATITMK
jgi:hypothetical protein